MVPKDEMMDEPQSSSYGTGGRNVYCLLYGSDISIHCMGYGIMKNMIRCVPFRASGLYRQHSGRRLG